MKAKIVRLQVYPCYLVVVYGMRGKIADALTGVGIKFTSHEEEVEFLLNKRDGAFVVELEKLYIPNPAQRKLGWKRGHIILAWFPNNQLRDRTDIGYVAHECIHLKNLILSYIGQKSLSLKDDELEANTYDWIFRQVFNALKPIRRK